VKLGKKALTVLRLAAIPIDDPMRRDLTEAAARVYSQKAVDKKFEDLVREGYMECGVSARTGWLTPKGRAALDAAER